MRPLHLPFFLTERNKLFYGSIVVMLAALMYFLTNHLPVFTPVELPLTFVDEWIPFVPWTVVIYCSEYLFFAAVFFTSRNIQNLNKCFYSFFFTQSFSCLVFLIWPTIFPRDRFVIPEESGLFLKTIWAFLRASDAPTNCFPSLHVSTVFLCAFLFRDEQREKYPFFLTWGSLIALSTLPTKQHYVADVIAGLALALASYWFFHRLVQYVPMSDYLKSRRQITD